MTLFGGCSISVAILSFSCQNQNVGHSIGYRTRSGPNRHKQKAFGVKCCIRSLNGNTGPSWIGYDGVESKGWSSFRDVPTNTKPNTKYTIDQFFLPFKKGRKKKGFLRFFEFRECSKTPGALKPFLYRCDDCLLTQPVKQSPKGIPGPLSQI